jgi:hypothetical protein
VNNATMLAVRFDPVKLETRGTAVPVLGDVAYASLTFSSQFAFSPAPSGHGTLVYRMASGGAPAMTTLEWVDPTGRREPLRAKPGVYGNPSLSPDGKRVALTIREGGTQDVWVYDLQRDAMTPDFRRRDLLQSDLEPGWPTRRFYVLSEWHLPGSRGRRR